VKNQKNLFKSGLVKSCLFLLNNDNCQEITNEEYEKAQKEVIDMIFNCNIIDKNDLKLCFFNANYYCDYLKNYNYFFNIKNTFFFELDNYIKSKNYSFKWPEISSNKNCNSFVWIYS